MYSNDITSYSNNNKESVSLQNTSLVVTRGGQWRLVVREIYITTGRGCCDEVREK